MPATRLTSEDFPPLTTIDLVAAAELSSSTYQLGERMIWCRAIMSCQAVNRSLRRSLRASSTSTSIPVFLLPKWFLGRSFSSSPVSQSRIGNAPISVPPQVSLRFFDLPRTDLRSRKKDVPVLAVEVTGPLGTSPNEELDINPADLMARSDDTSTATIFDRKSQHGKQQSHVEGWGPREHPSEGNVGFV